MIKSFVLHGKFFSWDKPDEEQPHSVGSIKKEGDMQKFFILILVLVGYSFSLNLQTISKTNFIEYYSLVDTNNIYPSITIDHFTGTFKIDLYDLDTETKIQTFNINYLFVNNFTRGWSGVNKFVIVKGLQQGTNDYILVFLNNGEGTGTWETFKGFFTDLYFINLNTEKKLFEEKINPDLVNFKTVSLNFSSSGVYLSGKCQNSTISPIDDIDFLIELNDVSINTTTLMKRKQNSDMLNNAYESKGYLLDGRVIKNKNLPMRKVIIIK